MVGGARVEKADDRLSGIFQESLRTWEIGAGNAGGAVERSYNIAGYPVRLRFAGPALVDAMTRALAHLEADPALKPMLTIHVADSGSTGKGPPAPLELMTEGQSSAGWIHRGKRMRARFQPDTSSLHILDSSQDSAIFWTEDALRIRFWERSAPLHYLFHWWMGSHGRQLIHAAAVGTAGGGALLVGRAGAGKSTAALSCLQSELGYAGDDYHLIALEPLPFAFSLYNSAKLNAAQLQQFEQLRHAVANPHELAQEKAVLFIHECCPKKISPGFPIRAVLVPRITHRKQTAFMPASPATALAALAPSTIFQLRDRGAGSFEAMAELLRRVPSFVLELGTDLPQIAPVILELLSRFDASREAKPRPLVSVIVPVYNGERFLAEALDSIFAQDYRPVEVIVVDDGSEDRTAAIASSFKGLRYLFQSRQGQAAARNAGIKEARGEFIAFLDTDDLMLPNKLSAQVNYLLHHPESGCVLSRRETFFETGVEPPSWLSENIDANEGVGTAHSSSQDFGELWHLREGGMSSVLVRRQLLERIGGFNPCYRHMDDLDWLFRVRESGAGVGVLPQVLWRRRIHGTNLTYQRKAIVKEWIGFIKERIDRRRAAASESKPRRP
jgi:hypothetical protein